MRQATSSGDATLSPCRVSMVWMKLDAACSDSCVPVSSHADAAPEHLHAQLAASRYSRVDIGDLVFAARRRLESRRDVDDVAVVEVQARDREARPRHARLLLDADARPVGIQLHDAIPLGIAHVVARRSSRPGSRQPASRKLLGESRRVKDVVAEDQRRRSVADERRGRSRTPAPARSAPPARRTRSRRPTASRRRAARESAAGRPASR